MPAAEVRSELDRILASPEFAKAKRSARLLRFLVERALDGQAQTLKEFAVALEVFDRDHTFDPRIDSLVRVEAARLRTRLSTYYEKAHAGVIRIELHAGSYVPAFVDARDGPIPNTPGTKRTVRRVLWRATAAAVLVFASIGAWLYAARFHEPRQLTMLNARRLTAYSGITAYPSLSPDLKWLVCSSDRGGGKELHLWRYPLPGGEPLQLTFGPQNDTAPAISPDGKWIAFESASKPGGIYLIPSAGGERTLVAPSGLGPRFSPDGAWLSYWIVDPDSTFGKVFIVPVGRAGEPIGIAREFDDAHTPSWAPESQGLLICGTRHTRGGPEEEHDLWFVPLKERRAVKTGAFAKFAKAGLNPHANLLGRTSFQWLEDGVVFPGSAEGRVGLWWLPLSASSWRALGDPIPAALTTEQQMHPSFKGRTLAFTSASVQTNVWSVPIDADQAKSIGEARRLTDETFDHLSPSISTDGRALVFLSASHGARLQARKWEGAGGLETPLSDPDRSTNRLKVSPDGRTAYYRVLDGPEPQLQAIYSADLATGQTARVCRDCGAPTHVSPDGRIVIFETGSTPTRLSALWVGTGAKSEFARHPHFGLHSARVSPDGRWIGFHVDRGWDGKQIFIAPFRDAAPIQEANWIPITGTGSVNQEVWWSPRGTFLYFLSDRDGSRCIWAQRLDPRTHKPAGAAIAIYHFHHARLTPLSFLWRSPEYIGLSVANDHLVLSLTEFSSNVWIGEIKR